MASRRSPFPESHNVVPQLRVLRDYQRVDSLPERGKEYFREHSVPQSFYVRGEALRTLDPISICKHINLISGYYDRSSPYIVIRNSVASPKPDKIQHLRMINGSFPRQLAVRELDDILLILLQEARHSPPRVAFLYYYQIFEYAGHYYIDDKARKELRRLLRDPALAECDDRKVGTLFGILTDLHRHDEQRMERVITDHCEPGHVWAEIENDKQFFCAAIQFDGGFVMDAIVSPSTTRDAYCTAWMPSLFKQLTAIRNCIVHARERREDKVILPTNENTQKLNRIIPLIRRVAEDLVIRG